MLGDVLGALTGSRPEARNRLKFFLLSPIYDGFYRFLPADPHRTIASRLPADARRVLDLCTGTALVPAVVAADRPETLVVGLDLSPEMLAIGRDKLVRRNLSNAPLVRADAGRLPFHDAAFDAVTVSYGLHELPTDVRDLTLRETRRVLRPGGCVIVADLDRPPRLGWLVEAYLRVFEPTYARGVFGEGLLRTFAAAGFRAEREPAEGAIPMQVVVARPEPA